MRWPIPALIFAASTTLAGLALAPTGPATSPISAEDALLRRATLVFSRAVQTPASAIPAAVLMRATAIAVIPGAAKDGVRYYGKGVMSARGARPDAWTPPAIIGFEGDVTLNLETEALDFVLVAQSRRGLDWLTQGQFAGARPVAAGAVGHNALPGPNADLLAYGQFDRYFAGIAVDRWTLQEATASNAALYGRPYSTDDIVRGAGFFHLPTSARLWREALAEYFREMT